MDESRFHANYDTFPEPLLLKTAEGGWLSNPAADDLCLSQTDYDCLAQWHDSSSLWLAGRFFYVHGHRTPDGLFLLLHSDAFLSSTALNLSSQLRQRLSSAFYGMSGLKEHLSTDQGAAREDLSAINRALHQIFRIVTELDHCSEQELLCHKSCLDLNTWLCHLGDKLCYWCDLSKGITLHTEPSSDPLTVAADSLLLDHMVTHLVSNAIQAAPNEQAEVSIALKKQGGQAVITVSGNGPGFSPAFLTDPLWNQPDRLLVGRGLGLGLPIAQRIAALHGGSLKVSTSSDDSQADVIVSLPLAPSDLLMSSAPRPPIDPTGGFSMERVLLSNVLSLDAFQLDIDLPE